MGTCLEEETEVSATEKQKFTNLGNSNTMQIMSNKPGVSQMCSYTELNPFERIAVYSTRFSLGVA